MLGDEATLEQQLYTEEVLSLSKAITSAYDALNSFLKNLQALDKTISSKLISPQLHNELSNATEIIGNFITPRHSDGFSVALHSANISERLNEISSSREVLIAQIENIKKIAFALDEELGYITKSDDELRKYIQWKDQDNRVVPVLKDPLVKHIRKNFIESLRSLIASLGEDVKDIATAISSNSKLIPHQAHPQTTCSNSPPPHPQSKNTSQPKHTMWTFILSLISCCAPFMLFGDIVQRRAEAAAQRHSGVKSANDSCFSFFGKRPDTRQPKPPPPAPVPVTAATGEATSGRGMRRR